MRFPLSYFLFYFLFSFFRREEKKNKKVEEKLSIIENASISVVRLETYSQFFNLAITMSVFSKKNCFGFLLSLINYIVHEKFLCSCIARNR